MAPKRRVSGPAAGKSNQSTLTFNGHPSRVTKPSAHTQSAKSKAEINTKLGGDTSKPAQSLNLADIADTRAEKVVLEQAQEEAERVAVQKSPEEEAASKISEARIKKYWRDKENQRRAKRVHQEDLSLHERVLREWDISAQYGVCPHFRNHYFS